MKKSSSKKKTIWIIGGIVVIAGIVGAFLLSQTSPSSADDTAPALQTSKVRTGDLVVSAAGSGSVLSSAQAELGFRTSGIVSAVYVSAGQAVEKGDISEDSYENFLKLRQESAFHDLSRLEKRQKDKDFGRFINKALKQMKK